MKAVIANVGSLVQSAANNMDDNKDEDYGFTSLLVAQSYDVPGTNLNKSRNLF